MSMIPNRTIRLTIFSAPCCLPVVRAALEKMCELVGFDERSAHGVVLSVDEALTNVIRHAYKGAVDQPIEIDLTVVGEGSDTAIRICLRDYGPPVDPERIKSRDLTDVRPGGLGVHIIKHCMDSVEYRPLDGGGTMLTMVKVVSSQKESKVP
jgi:anti-sigma regulatory factor (Ser/Thr protein kinase)